jgi:hypothetical protein
VDLSLKFGSIVDSACPKDGLTLALPKRQRERGSGALKAIFWTAVIAAFVYVGFKVTPCLVNEYEFQDGIQTIARFASVNRQPAEQIKASVLKEAQNDGVTLNPEDIKVVSSLGNVQINVRYSVTIDLAVYQWTLNFNPTVANASLT